jgi:type IV secretory pathway VirB4 component
VPDVSAQLAPAHVWRHQRLHAVPAQSPRPRRGHSFIFGPTGAGKSTLLGLLAAQLRRYPGMSIFAFDKGLSLYPLAKAVGGAHFTVAGDDEKLAFCPLQFLETKSDRAWAMDWIDTILALNGVATTPAQRNEIGNAIVNMHASGAKPSLNLWSRFRMKRCARRSAPTRWTALWAIFSMRNMTA